MATATISCECLVGRPEDLPRCTWEEFAAAMGIENAVRGKELLNRLASSYRESKTAELPVEVICAAGEGVDPYVFWLWTLDVDFRVEPEGVVRPKTGTPKEHYLLHFMAENCKNAPTMCMDQLIQHCLHDKECYREVQFRAMRQWAHPVKVEGIAEVMYK
jgi:hypothetical protein